ncbi:MAG: hypothetical protein J5809_05300 [Selenomonadaceae bacterium]|nr:hypothetical protein [Selenomonadaceae bacterium]
MAEQETFKALLFDTRSIQRYIYSGNRLSTNIGASYIVDRVFYDVLIKEVLREMFKAEFPDDTTWESKKDKDTPWVSMKECCVAYIGGGNALVLMKADAPDRRTEIVREFTRRLLVERPGLRVGAAQGDLTLTDGKLDQKKIDDLYLELKNVQKNVFPTVSVPYTGLTLSCEINGEAANFCDTEGIVKPREGGEIRFYSQETAVKADIAKKEANVKLLDRFKEIFGVKGIELKISHYEFPLEVDKLGQKEGENYFAIVHVDGNNMGLKFRACKSLNERRKLSREIRRKTEGAFADLLAKIIRLKEKGAFNNYLKLEKNFLPIRPLIIGGDDVTFLCPANMAVLFTKSLMEFMSAETPENTPEQLTEKISRHMDCCAGIAILPTAYPFFRGYELAEQLCDSAKKSMRALLPKDLNDKEDLTAEDIPDGSSWLDYAILYGEQAPTLEQIRETEYKGARGNLHFGPYRVANENSRHASERRYNIENLLDCTTQFKSDRIANNKAKELRGVLQHGREDAAKFVQQLEYQQQSLPEIADWKDFLTDELWSSGDKPQTPYVDAIELMDFYVPEVAEEWQKLQ